jgi:hypothetical protein
MLSASTRRLNASHYNSLLKKRPGDPARSSAVVAVGSAGTGAEWETFIGETSLGGGIGEYSDGVRRDAS